MSENYVKYKETNGTINIAEDVILSLVKASIEEVEGVKGIGSMVSSDITERITKKTSSKGIKIHFEEDAVSVDASILVCFGMNVVDVAKKVQSNVFETLSGITGAENAVVNIHVAGIAFER